MIAEKVNPKVTLLFHTPNPEVAVALAAKRTTSKKLPKSLDDESVKSLIRLVVRRGHHSVLEHAVFTFSIEEISRVCVNQLIRHRIASYSQRSDRVTKPSKAVVPRTVFESERARAIFEKAVEEAFKAYEGLLKIGIPREDARYVLPFGVESQIIVTMNARELLHFFKLRCCMRAQEEIRLLAWRMLKLVKEVAPAIFESAGPPCIFDGRCLEEVDVEKCKAKLSEFVARAL